MINFGISREPITSCIKQSTSSPSSKTKCRFFKSLMFALVILVVAVIMLAYTMVTTNTNDTKTRFIIVIENNNVSTMYESKGGVISTIQTNQFEVLRK